MPGELEEEQQRQDPIRVGRVLAQSHRELVETCTWRGLLDLTRQEERGVGPAAPNFGRQDEASYAVNSSERLTQMQPDKLRGSNHRREESTRAGRLGYQDVHSTTIHPKAVRRGSFRARSLTASGASRECASAKDAPRGFRSFTASAPAKF